MYLVQYSLTAQGQSTIPILVNGASAIKIENNGTNSIVAECQLHEDGTWKSVALFNSQTVQVVPAMAESGFYELDVENFYAVRFTLVEFVAGTTELAMKVVTD